MPSPLFLLPYRAHAPPSTSNSTGPAALTYTLCGRAPGARQRTPYGYRYCFICLLPSVTAVDGHGVYLRRTSETKSCSKYLYLHTYRPPRRHTHHCKSSASFLLHFLSPLYQVTSHVLHQAQASIWLSICCHNTSAFLS